MPAGRPSRTPSRGRPPKKGGAVRSQSASRKTSSTKKTSRSPAKKTIPKITPKTRSGSRSRKVGQQVSTAPAAVSAKGRHERATLGRQQESPRSRTTVTGARAGASSSFISSVTVSSSGIRGRGSISPPLLRSRALGAALAAQTQQPAPSKKIPRKQWALGQSLRNNPVSQQLTKLGCSISQKGPLSLVKSAANHLRINWKSWLLALALLLLAGLIYKFQRELLTNVQQINKQVLEFVQQQYEQQRQIFGHKWAKYREALEKTANSFLSPAPSPSPPQESTPPPKPHREPHLSQ